MSLNIHLICNINIKLITNNLYREEVYDYEKVNDNGNSHSDDAWLNGMWG